MFKNQHRGLYPLALANTGERFGYYIMLATLVLYMQAKFGFDENMAGLYYSIFLAAVYFMPVVGATVMLGQVTKLQRQVFRKIHTVPLFSYQDTLILSNNFQNLNSKF